MWLIVVCCEKNVSSSFDEMLARVLLPGSYVVVVMTVPAAVSVLLAVAGKAGKTGPAAGIACTVETVPGTLTGRTKAPRLRAHMPPIHLLLVGSTPHTSVVAVAHRMPPPILTRMFN